MSSVHQVILGGARQPSVEARHGNDRLGHESIASEIGRLIEGASAVTTLPDIRAFSHIDQPTHAKLHFLSAASEGEARFLTHRCLQVRKSLLDTRHRDAVASGVLLEALTPVFEQGAFKAPKIDRIIPLSEGRSAYEQVARGEERGRLVLAP